MSDTPDPSDAESESEPFEVPAFFNDPQGDLTIISSDSYHFCVFRSILICGSSFFRDMFSHPQSEGSTSDSEPLRWDEPASTIVLLLSYVYPMAKPTIESLEQALTLTRAADKWGMEYVLSLMRVELINDEELKKSAMTKLIETFDPLDPRLLSDLRGLDALEFAGIMNLRNSRIKRAKQLIAEACWTKCPHGLERYNSANIREIKAFLSKKLSTRPTLSWTKDWSNFLDHCAPRCDRVPCADCPRTNLGSVIEWVASSLDSSH